jgi:hypothetical protein
VVVAGCELGAGCGAGAIRVDPPFGEDMGAAGRPLPGGIAGMDG